MEIVRHQRLRRRRRGRGGRRTPGPTVVDQYLAHEEGELEPLLRDHLESPEWKAAMRQMRTPAAAAGRLVLRLARGRRLGRGAGYLGAEVPAPVRVVLGRVFGRGYHRTIAPVWA